MAFDFILKAAVTDLLFFSDKEKFEPERKANDSSWSPEDGNFREIEFDDAELPGQVSSVSCGTFSV
jgi:hypothetical protein